MLLAFEKSEQKTSEAKKQSTPVIGCSFKQLIGRIFVEGKILVDNNAAEEVLTDKWQIEYGLYQRANTMTVAFSYPTSVQKGAHSKSVEKVINFALKMNVSFIIEGNVGMLQ